MVAPLNRAKRTNTIASSIFFYGDTQALIHEAIYDERNFKWLLLLLVSHYYAQIRFYLKMMRWTIGCK